MRAIITDLDRTLLRTDKTLSERTIRVLRRCHEEGITLMVATARPERAIGEYLKRIPFDAAATLNGAVVLLPGGKEAWPISADSARQMLTALSAFPEAFISMETASGILANRPIPEWNAMVCDSLLTPIGQTEIYKILISSPDRTFVERMARVLTLDTYFTLANGTLMQIMSRRATKWRGILTMLHAFGLSPDEAVYFGDDQDDLEPLRCCGIGVAVANALDEVKLAADTVTKSNDEDGVADYLETVLAARGHEAPPQSVR